MFNLMIILFLVIALTCGVALIRMYREADQYVDSLTPEEWWEQDQQENPHWREEVACPQPTKPSYHV